jgi:hypothetical protein
MLNNSFRYWTPASAALQSLGGKTKLSPTVTPPPISSGGSFQTTLQGGGELSQILYF